LVAWETEQVKKRYPRLVRLFEEYVGETASQSATTLEERISCQRMRS